MYGLVVALHIIACIVLIMVILLQAGRGGGLSEGLGVGLTQSLFGTKANVFLTRATSVCAIMFLVTCLLLDIMISKQGKSLVQYERLMQEVQRQAQSAATTGSAKETGIPNDVKVDLPKAAPENVPAAK